MTCLACQGIGWLIRKIDHPYLSAGQCTVSRVCPYCSGKGRVEPEPQLLLGLELDEQRTDTGA
jgi:DnaJ-class molecular chaperone